jgi:HPt (histidine-containing phosphotransfer) domain-containing protein
VSDGPAIDAAVFANLIEMTGGDHAFVDDLVDTYLDDGQTQISALTDAAASGDQPDLVRPAHSLKSSSVNIGALRVGQLSRDLEERARSGVIDDAVDRVAAIAAAFDEARRDLLDERRRRAEG